MNINCIGYKSGFCGDKIWHYKLNHNGNEFLIVDANMNRLLDMVWTKNNEFENAIPDFMSYDFLDNDINTAIQTIEKNEKQLNDDEEKTFFKQYEPEPEIITIPNRIGNVYTYNEVNDILNVLRNFDFIYNKGKYQEITQDIADWANENGYNNLFDELVGYKFKVTSKGTHKNDSHMVEYSFTLKSPHGRETKFSTEMCLMVGWNYYENLKIK